MVLLDRSKVPKIQSNVFFIFKLNFKLDFFQNGIRPGAL
jgi:hypothetical protein